MEVLLFVPKQLFRDVEPNIHDWELLDHHWIVFIHDFPVLDALPDQFVDFLVLVLYVELARD